jgi:transcriptional regulator GlxA family with amidase domain
MTDAKRLGVLAFEGFEELDAVGPYEVFGNARDRGADLTVELLATEDTDRVSAALGLTVEPDGRLSAADRLDYLLVPGGGWNDGSGTGTRALVADGDTLDTLRGLHAAGTTLLGVCTGGMVLAEAGLLAGRPAVTHHGAMADLRETGAAVVEARVVDDGDVLTCGGVTAGIDLTLWLVEREWGPGVAADVETVMEYERSDDVYRERAP